MTPAQQELINALSHGDGRSVYHVGVRQLGWDCSLVYRYLYRLRRKGHVRILKCPNGRLKVHIMKGEEHEHGNLEG